SWCGLSPKKTPPKGRRPRPVATQYDPRAQPALRLAQLDNMQGTSSKPISATTAAFLGKSSPSNQKNFECDNSVTKTGLRSPSSVTKPAFQTVVLTEAVDNMWSSSSDRTTLSTGARAPERITCGRWKLDSHKRSRAAISCARWMSRQVGLRTRGSPAS